MLFRTCAIACGNIAPWTAEQTAFLIEHYAECGAAWVSEQIGVDHDRVIRKANTMKVGLSKESTRRIVHDRAAEHMREDNPSRRPGATEKLRQRVRDNPHIVEKMIEGQAQLQKENPTKLETKLARMLDSLGVQYEHHVLIKKHFIVDFRLGQLIIEADGDWWHGHRRFEPLIDRQVRQQKRDAARNKYLTTCGYTVVRIWESDMTIDTVRRVVEKHRDLVGEVIQSKPTCKLHNNDIENRNSFVQQELSFL